jgi:tripartite-type tricarboxylate transporter receptor subunit TctC
MPADHCPSRRAALLGLAAVTATQGMPGRASAQAYPAKPPTLIVTFAAGGGVDVTSRLVAETLGQVLGQRVLVENRGGGATVTGTQAVARAAPDGYMLLAAPTTMVINPALRATMPFDWASELAPVGLMAKLPFVVVTRPDSPLKSMKDLEALAKRQDKPLLFASGGTGTVAHLAGELFAIRIGAKMQHVAYRGEGPSLADVAGGSLDVTFATLAGVAGQVQGGTLKALGVTTAERAALLPEVPTIAEQGYADFDVSAWVGLMAPQGTPAEVLRTLRAALDKALGDAQLRGKLEKSGSIPAAPAQDFAAFLRREAEIWAKVVREAQIKIEP